MNCCKKPMQKSRQLATDKKPLIKSPLHPKVITILIIMDIQMPVMDGLEATRQIRHLDRQDIKDMPIIAMSANAFAEDVRLSLEAGMNEHIAKPIEIDKLYGIMRKWFQ